MTHINYAEEGNQTRSLLSAMKLGLDSYIQHVDQKVQTRQPNRMDLDQQTPVAEAVNVN